MPDNPMLWIISPTGAVETFFPCAQGAEPAVPPGYILSRAPPAPKALVPIRVITLVAFLSRATDAEKVSVAANPLLFMALLEKVAEGGVPVINLDSPKIAEMLMLAGMPATRISEIIGDGNPAEAA